MLPPPPRSTLFPYTTLFRSVTDEGDVNAPAAITFPIADAERVVGVPYTPEQVRGTLERIGCTLEQAGAETLMVTPPSWRPDLTIREDLVEEIARLVGYEQIPSLLPSAPGGRGLTRAQRARRSASRALVEAGDRKSTRLNSSHVAISYAVFCLKKKKNTRRRARTGR